MRLIRHQLRSMFPILGVFAVVGAAYELISSGALTPWGPITGSFVGVPLVVLQVLFPLAFMRSWPFAASVLARALLYIMLILLVFLSIALVYGLLHGLTLRDFANEMWSRDTVTKVAVGFGASVVIIFFQQLNRLLGPGNLVRYIFGRYYRPRQEARIFMFLDLKGSTSIAERLDVGTYYAFLNDVFHHIAEPVLATRAQIYQYVGDQVVLTWPMATGLSDANCIRVFYEIDAVIQRHAPDYLARYGLVPEFKAGLHGGEVISAEIGDLKRDLIYSGDVLNTTGRIQAECNRLYARLLLSMDLFERVVLPSGVEAESLGEVELRGKRHAIGLVRVWRSGEARVSDSAREVSRANQPVRSQIP
jgi:adenylate cyclase